MNDSIETRVAGVDSKIEGVPAAAAHFMRSVHSHHVTLNALADRKANFVLGASFLSISIMMTSDLKYLIVTLSVAVFLNIIASTLAIFAIIPKYKLPKNVDPKDSLFFFGSFGNRPFEDFSNDVLEVLRSEEKVFRYFTKDIYMIGQILMKRKFKYISWSYRFFLMSLLVTPVIYLIEGYSVGWLK